MKPILSIIVISYNTAKITLNCLKSISQDKGLKDIPYEIIVVDNASTDDSATLLKQLKNITFIQNKTNVGFSKANNQAINIAKGNFVLLLNSDTIINHGAISQTLNWLTGHPESAACTAQLLNQDGTIQASGGFFPNMLNIFTWSTGLDDLPFVNLLIKPFHPHSPSFYTHDSFYQKNHPQDWITGAYILIRKNIIDSLGAFDENYFMYAEEVEWLYRVKKQFPKLSINYLVGAQVTHLGGASSPTKLNTITNEYLGIINFFAKHKGSFQTNLIKHILKLNASLRSILYQLIGKKELALFYSEACSKI